MLGPLSRKMFFKGYKWGTLLFNMPYYWDFKTKQLHVKETGFRKHAWHFSITASIIGPIWLILRTLQVYPERNLSSKHMAFYMTCSLMTICSILPLILHLNTIRFRYQLPFINYQFISFIKFFKENYFLPEKLKAMENWRNDRPGVICTLIYWSTAVSKFFIMAIVLAVPDLPCLLTSIEFVKSFPDYLLVPLKIIQFVVILYYILSWFAFMDIYGYPTVEFIFTAVKIIREFSLGRSSYDTMDKMRQEKEFLMLYSLIRYFFEEVTSILSPLAIPAAKGLLSAISIYLIYGTIRLEGLYAVAMGFGAVAALTYLTVVFTVIATFPELTEDLHRSWLSKPNLKPYVAKKLKSFRPWRVYIGSMYYADRQMVMNMYRFLLDCTIDLIMLY